MLIDIRYNLDIGLCIFRTSVMVDHVGDFKFFPLEGVRPTSSILFVKKQFDLVHVRTNCVVFSCFRYDPSTGIYGMDFFVVLERPGYRVGRRRRCKSRVGIQHRVTKEDSMKWFQMKYEGVILNKSQNTT